MIDKILSDLIPFADLGTEAPRVASSSSTNIMRMVRGGREIELSIRASGPILLRCEGEERRHYNIQALLASPDFGDLARWAKSQTAHLRQKIKVETISLVGDLDSKKEVPLETLDKYFVPDQKASNSHIRILFVDGPAGIGKTSLIRKMAYIRSSNYGTQRRPLLLHVESRGRVLQNIDDLMAFSLQTMRLNVTFDQIPILVRHGLITLAIDGFDELADPNGYELAWGRLNELINDVRGKGSLILAGRETFIGQDRLLNALPNVKTVDSVKTFTVCPLTPSKAQSWLKKEGWDESMFTSDVVAPIFEVGSYALRPFFLFELAKREVRQKVMSGDFDDITWVLISAMIERESSKFGDSIEAELDEEERQKFVTEFLIEVARDLADNQTDAISIDSLAWLAEVVAEDNYSDTVASILKHRVADIAFLTSDDRPGYRRFSHTHVLNHFLSRTIIDSLAAEEIPKFVRRNILGSDFWMSFLEVIGNFPEEDILKLVKNCVKLASEVTWRDRSRGNLTSIVLASIATISDSDNFEIDEVQVNEAVVSGTAGAIYLTNTSIAQLDLRSADLRSVNFGEGCYITSIIGNQTTLLPKTFPIPQRIQFNGGVISAREEIERWICEHTQSSCLGGEVECGGQASPRDHPIYDLIGRVCRARTYWVREGEDGNSSRITGHPHWSDLQIILSKNQLLSIRHAFAASERSSSFFHVKRKLEILSEEADEQIMQFYDDVDEYVCSDNCR